jgi:ComF family protein
VHGVCGACQRRPPAFASTRGAFHYAPPIDHFVRSLKFNHDLGLAALLGTELARVAGQTPRPDLIVPVPLHGSRLRSRGYNQALEIARVVARGLGLPLDAHGLVRRRATSAQSDLPLAARRRNVRGAFAVRARTNYRDLRIALVDDVMTSGSTVDAAARALRTAGAARVDVWVVARA